MFIKDTFHNLYIRSFFVFAHFPFSTTAAVTAVVATYSSRFSLYFFRLPKTHTHLMWAIFTGIRTDSACIQMEVVVFLVKHFHKFSHLFLYSLQFYSLSFFSCFPVVVVDVVFVCFILLFISCFSSLVSQTTNVSLRLFENSTFAVNKDRLCRTFFFRIELSSARAQRETSIFAIILLLVFICLCRKWNGSISVSRLLLSLSVQFMHTFDSLYVWSYNWSIFHCIC